MILFGMFYPYPFEKSIVEYSTTTAIPTGHLYNYFIGNDEKITQDANGKFSIDETALEKSSLFNAFINKIFGSPLGLYDICFENTNSTFYFYNYKTDLNQPIEFIFNDKEIIVPRGQEKCETIYANAKFQVIINHAYYPPNNKDLNTFIQNDKGFLQFVKEKSINLSLSKPIYFPLLFSDIYDKPNPITLIVAYGLILIAWSGLIFWKNEFRNYIK